MTRNHRNFRIARGVLFATGCGLATLALIDLTAYQGFLVSAMRSVLGVRPGRLPLKHAAPPLVVAMHGVSICLSLAAGAIVTVAAASRFVPIGGAPARIHNGIDPPSCGVLSWSDVSGVVGLAGDEALTLIACGAVSLVAIAFVAGQAAASSNLRTPLWGFVPLALLPVTIGSPAREQFWLLTRSDMAAQSVLDASRSALQQARVEAIAIVGVAVALFVLTSRQRAARPPMIASVATFIVGSAIFMASRPAARDAAHPLARPMAWCTFAVDGYADLPRASTRGSGDVPGILLRVERAGPASIDGCRSDPADVGALLEQISQLVDRHRSVATVLVAASADTPADRVVEVVTSVPPSFEIRILAVHDREVVSTATLGEVSLTPEYETYSVPGGVADLEALAETSEEWGSVVDEVAAGQ